MALNFLNNGYFAGKVGIGTASPSAKLVVDSGSFAVQGISTPPTSGFGLEFWNNSATSYMGAYNRTTAVYRDLLFFANETIFQNTGTERMRVTSAGGISFGSTGNAYGASGQILKSNGSASPTWIDGSAIPGVPAGSGTLNTVAMWTPDGDTLGDAPITISGNNSTFAGDVTINKATPILTFNSSNVNVDQGIVFSNTGTFDASIKHGPSSADMVFDIGRNSTWGGAANFKLDTYQTYYMTKNSHAFKILGVDALSINSSSNATFAGSVSAEDNIYLTDAGTVRAKLLLNASDRDNVELRAESLGSTMKFFTVGTEALELDASQNATFAGDITVTGNQYFNGTEIQGDGKTIIRYSDAWLRINPDRNFTNGIYCGTGFLRTDGEFQVGASGTYAKITSTGNATFAGNLNVNGNATLGDATTDDHVFNGQVTQVTGDALGYKLLRSNGGTSMLISATSDAEIEFGTDNGSGTNTTQWTIGKDGTDNSFRISNSASLGTSDTLTLTGANATFAGNIVMANAKILYTDDIRANSGAMAVGPTGASALTLRTSSTTRLTIASGGDATFTEQAFSAATSSGDASSTLTTKGYVDGLITGATIYRGTWQAGVSATSTGTTTASTTLTVSAAILDAAGNTPTLVGAVVTGAGITGTVKVSSVTSSTVYVLDTAIDATATAYIFSPIYGAPDLSGVTQTSGYYYICSEAGSATPNGAGTEPNTWGVGDWVIWNDDVGASGEWQKVDNSSVLSGAGTGQTVALWEGPSSVTDSETLGNAPITVSGNNTTFAGSITANTTSTTTALLGRDGTDGDVVQIYNGATGTTKVIALGASGNDGTIYSQYGDLLLQPSAGNVGIGLTGPDNTLMVRGASTTGAASAGNVALFEGPSGTNGLKVFVDDTGNAAGFQTISTDDLLINPHGGNVGIGTDDPASILHVEGGSSTTNLIASSGNGFLRIADSATSATRKEFTILLDNTNNRVDMQAIQQGVAARNITLNASGGNVGIGTDDPAARLEVSTTGFDVGKFTGNTDDGAGYVAAVVEIESNENGRGRGVYLTHRDSTDTTDSEWYSGVPYTGTGYTIGNAAYGTSVNSDTGPAVLAQSRFFIQKDGKVGIGTTSPGEKLDVAGNIELSTGGYIYGDGNAYLRLSNAAGALLGYGAGYIALGPSFTYNNASGELFRIQNSNGNVGIGTTSPRYQLDLAEAQNSSQADYIALGVNNGNPAGTGTALGSGLIWKANFTGYTKRSAGIVQIAQGSFFRSALAFYTNGTANTTTDWSERMRIDMDGNVGIGVTGPQSKLQVAGGIQMADDDVDAVAAKAGTMRYRTATNEAVPVTGTELIINGDFVTDSDWTKGVGWTISGGTANGNFTSNPIYQTVSGFTAGNKYRVRFEVTAVTSGYVRVYAYVGASGTFTNVFNSPSLTTGVYEATFEFGGTNKILRFYGSSGGTTFTGSIDNISVLEVTEEDASYADMCMQTGASTYEWVNIVRNTY